ncbi:hypothetical protein D3C73_913520 [compost metagenome]
MIEHLRQTVILQIDGQPDIVAGVVQQILQRRHQRLGRSLVAVPALVVAAQRILQTVVVIEHIGDPFNVVGMITDIVAHLLQCALQVVPCLLSQRVHGMRISECPHGPDRQQQTNYIRQDQLIAEGHVQHAPHVTDVSGNRRG